MKYEVKSVSLDRHSWRFIAERVEIVTAGEDIFAHCVNGRAIGRTYEFYWNELVDSPTHVIRVTGVTHVG